MNELESTQSKIPAEIMQAEQLWMSAFIDSNGGLLSSLVTDDFIAVVHGGRVLDRLELAAEVNAGEVKIRSVEIKESRARVYDSTVIVSATELLEAEIHGKSFRGPSQTTRVWINTNGRWQVAAFHASDARVITKWNEFVERNGEMPV